MKVVILCAGRGERLKPLTETRSKVMIPVANKPLLEWTLDALQDTADEIILVVREEQRDIIDAFPECKFVYQKEPLGTADAIACCRNYVAGKFLVIMGDDYISKEDIEKFTDQENMAAGYFIADDPEKFGVFAIKEDKITDVVEKPVNSEHNTINCGIYLFDEGIFNFIKRTKKSERGEYEITDAIKLMINEGIDIRAIKLDSWQPVGYPWHLFDLSKLILEKTGSIIGENVAIKPGAYIEGPVAIDDNSVIGPNCCIRKYSSIGKNCKIGGASEVKNSIIMDNTHIPHLNYVGDSVIGEGCNIAAGTIFANLRLDEKPIKMMVKGNKTDSGRKKLGCFVGDNVKFGINVSVMPGIKIWPNLLIPPCVIIREDLEEQPVL